MNSINKLIAGVSVVCALSACSAKDFLDASPKDALSPGTAWQTPDDAQKFLTGVYDGWESGEDLLYMDCTSDFGFNYHRHEGWRVVGDGSQTTSSPGLDFYNFGTIRRANLLLSSIDQIAFPSEDAKNSIIGQARFIRAYKYFALVWHYGKAPLIGDATNADEAKIAPKSEAEVRKYVEDELDACIKLLPASPARRGEIARGAALAMRMRVALYYEDYAKAKEMAQAIIDLGQYGLEDSYETLFTPAGQSSKEIILATQYINSTRDLWVIGAMLNNSEGGWSSIVPTANLINTYEMANGLTINEAGSGYDATHPFKGRDPRMAMTVLYPGASYTDINGDPAIYNTLDVEIAGKKNPDFPTAANNSSKTGLTWRKYTYPVAQYSDVWSTNACPIVFRYAEVLLSWAEAENELNGPSAEVYAKIDLVRHRAGMPDADKAKYATKETLRELIRRERGVEFAGEGLRRADIVRWKDASGKLVAETVLNGRLERMVGTVDMTGADPETRATINPDASAAAKLVEERVFKPHMRYLPLSQSVLDQNPNLKPTPGY